MNQVYIANVNNGIFHTSQLGKNADGTQRKYLKMIHDVSESVRNKNKVAKTIRAFKEVKSYTYKSIDQNVFARGIDQSIDETKRYEFTKEHIKRYMNRKIGLDFLP